MKKRMIVVSTALLALLLVFMTACGSNANGDPTDAPDPVLTEVVVSTDEVEDEITILRVGTAEGIENFNLFSGGSAAYEAHWLTSGGLVGGGRNCESTPRLAKSWDVSEDGLIWTFQLQEGATWSDGEPFNAQSYVDFINWWNSTELLYWWYTGWNIVDIQAVDEYTVQFTTEVPLNEETINGFDMIWWFVLPPQVWSQYDDVSLWEYNELPVGSGPYEVTEFEPNQYVIYDAQSDYYGGKPPVDRIVYQVFSTWEAVVQALLAGDIDITTAKLPLQYYSTLADSSDVVVGERPPGLIVSLFFNLFEGGEKHPAIDDPALREAIDYAIDRDQAIAVALEGHGQKCVNVMCGPTREKWSNPNLSLPPYDLTKAAEILEDAGYKDTDSDGVLETSDGLPLVFDVLVEVNQPGYIAIAEQLKSSLAEIGISLEIETLEFATWYNAVLNERNYDLALQHVWPEFNPMLYDSMSSCWSAEPGSGGFNRAGYCNPEVDDLLYVYATTADEKEAMDTIHQIQEIIFNDKPSLTIAGANMIEAMRTDSFDFPYPGEFCDAMGGHWLWPSILEVTPKK
jgi:peptide/nickel transport system substrate-binding protein